MVRSDGTVSDAGKVVEYDPPRRLAYTFVNLSDKYKGELPALATFVLEPYGKLVKLTLTHEGFAEGSKFFEGISKGWPAILSGLKSLLETGKPLDVPYAAMKSEELRRDETRQLQADDRLHHLHRLHAGEGVAGADDQPNSAGSIFSAMRSRSI